MADYEWPMSNGKTLCFDKYGKQYERESKDNDWNTIKDALPGLTADYAGKPKE